MRRRHLQQLEECSAEASADSSIGQLEVVLSKEESKETNYGFRACNCAKSRNTISGVMNDAAKERSLVKFKSKTVNKFKA